LTSILITLIIFNVPITKVNFIGNKSIPSRQLFEEIISKKDREFNDINLAYDLGKITRLYKSNGFFNAEAKPRLRTTEYSIDITFIITEGPRPRIKEIIASNVGKEKIENLFTIKVNDFFIGARIGNTEKRIEDYYKNRGYTFANVSSSMVPDSGVLFINIDKGVLYYIRNIELKGLKTCQRAVVRRSIEIKTGDRFSKSKLFISQRDIYGLGFFSTVDVEILKQQPDSVDLIFTVRELKSRILNFGLGFSIPADFLVNFLISFGLEELNLFNAGHGLQIQPSFKINVHHEWEVKLEGRYTVPNIMPARITTSVLPFYWVENDTAFIRKTKGAEFRLSKVYNENIQFNIANKYKFVDFEPKITLPDTFRGQTNSIKFQLMMDYRDEFFNPKNGIYLLPLIEYAGSFLGGDNNFLRLEVEERLFLPLVKNTFAQRLKIGVMIPTDGLAIYEKYYLGGQYSLRGYSERSIGPDSISAERYGNILANLNLEYRISLPMNLGLVAFCDVGYLDNEINFTRRDYLKASIGLGLRYNTLIGPLRCDIGFPLTESGREIYLGIYNVF